MKYLILGDTKENIVKISLIYSIEPPKSVGEYIATNTIPEPTEKEGKRAVLYYNKETKEIFYKYVDVPKTTENLQVDSLKKEVEGCKQSIAELTALASTAMVMPK